MTTREAEAILRRVCEGELDVWVTQHFWERVRERTPGFTKQHIYQVFRQGTIQGTPQPDEAYENHKIKVRAKLVDFGMVEIVVAIRWFDQSVCITIYGAK